MKHLKNEKGASLSAAIIVLLVVLALAGGFYLVANIYYNSAINNYSKRQAYIYAKNECQALATYLEDYGSSDNNPYYVEVNKTMNAKIKIEPRDSSNITDDNKIHFKDIKDADVVITHPHKDTIIYQVTTYVGRESSTVKLTCTYDNYDWHIDYYS